jgi:nucleoside-diphosphate-sugar epimerase
MTKLDKKNTVLVTGAGFVGRVLIQELSEIDSVDVIRAVRKHKKTFVKNNTVEIGDITDKTDWRNILSGVDVIIHTIARVHIMDDKSSSTIQSYMYINADATLNLARQAAEAGIKRFVFLSSIKVNGEQTLLGRPFTPNDINIPDDPYGLSKYQAEKGLLKIAEETGMEVVIIRPPLVYGPGVKANFASMMSWLKKGIPLPFGAINNKRSLIALDNLVDFIIHCIEHPKAANEVFLISDGDDVSTTELLKRTAAAMNTKAFLLPIPESWMRFFAKILGKQDLADRLLGSLQVDSSKAFDLLDWKPVTTMDEQLKKTVEATVNEKSI